MATPAPDRVCPFEKTFATLKPYLVPYYFAVAAMLGLITVVFGAVVGVLILMITNFNILGLIE
jgi:hypothetical protein